MNAAVFGNCRQWYIGLYVAAVIISSTRLRKSERYRSFWHLRHHYYTTSRSSSNGMRRLKDNQLKEGRLYTLLQSDTARSIRCSTLETRYLPSHYTPPLSPTLARLQWGTVRGHVTIPTTNQSSDWNDIISMNLLVRLYRHRSVCLYIDIVLYVSVERVSSMPVHVISERKLQVVLLDAAFNWYGNSFVNQWVSFIIQTQFQL